MPIVATWDFANRRIFIASGVRSFDPIEIYREHREYRATVEAARSWTPLVDMQGGSSKGGGAFVPRFLRLLTDNRSILTKLVFPDEGPYRCRILGEIITDNADVDPEPIDVSNITTGVIIDYQPPSAQLIEVAGTGDVQAALDAQGLTTARAALLDQLDPATAGTLADNAVLLRKLAINRREIIDIGTPNARIVYYDDDGTTVLVEATLATNGGEPVETQPGVQTRQAAPVWP